MADEPRGEDPSVTLMDWDTLASHTGTSNLGVELGFRRSHAD